MKARFRLSSFLLLILCLCLAEVSFGQVPRYQVGAGEYNTFILDNGTQTAYTTTTGALTTISGAPSKVLLTAAGAHHWFFVDGSYNVWSWGQNVFGEVGNGTSGNNINNPTLLSTDANGNPFNGVIQIEAGYQHTMALKSDGTVWVWGNVSGGLSGNGQNVTSYTRPTQVVFPAGTIITKIQMGIAGIAMDNAGNVWTWGGTTGNGQQYPWVLGRGMSPANPMSPQKISLPGPAIDIAGGTGWNYALLSNGNLYGWGYNMDYLGFTFTYPPPTSVPTLLTGVLSALPKPIRSIYVNNVATYAILTDSTLWAWGDNAVGGIGNGKELNYCCTAKPYAWDWGSSELMQIKPVPVGQGLHSFTNVWVGNGLVFYAYAEDVNGNLYAWGRNKSGSIANGVIDANPVSGAIASSYPNSWDVPYITKLNPFAVTQQIQSTSPYCISNPNGSPCNIYTVPVTAAPNCNAGPTQNITTPTTTLTGVTSGNGGSAVVYTIWTQLSGPSNALITIPSGDTAQVSNLVNGTYVFQLKATDNNWRSTSSTVTVNVNLKPRKPPVALADSSRTITYPTNSLVLDGSRSYDSSGTITSYQWTQATGPSLANLSNANSAKATAANLVQGVYVFFFVITDNFGATASASDTVYVIAPANAPSVNAGSNQTLILPTASTTLIGSATGSNGVKIVSTQWSQTSGPNASSLASPASLSTAVSGLIQGTYVFQLLATDSTGLTNAAQVTVTVNPANLPPSVNAGASQAITLPTSSATLSGLAVGVNGDTVVSQKWTQLSGPNSGSLATDTSLVTTVSGLTNGIYVFQLTATDNHGLTASATTTVTVNTAAAIPPTVTAGANQTIQLPVSSLTLSGSASANGGAVISAVSWSESSGPTPASITTPASLSTQATGLQAGQYVFQLTATDNNGLSTTQSVTVTVLAAASLPVVSAGSLQSISLPTSAVNLSGTATAASGYSITNTTWSQVSGPNTATFSSVSNLNTTVSGLVAGTYIFQLTATDNQGSSNASTVTVIVNPAPNVPPVANAGPALTVTLPTSTTTLDGSRSFDPDGTISSYSWSQLSGPSVSIITNSNAMAATASNLVAGVYLFNLLVTDNKGAASSSQVTITVVAGNSQNLPPVADAGSNQTIIMPVPNVVLNGSASYDPDGVISSYRWVQVSGTPLTLSGDNTAQAVITNPEVGIFTFELTVVDNSGASAVSNVMVTILDASQSGTGPVAVAGNDTTLATPSDLAFLNGSASSDPASSIVSYSWQQINGPAPAQIVSPLSAFSAVKNLTLGEYIFQLTVTNAQGKSSDATVRISVIDNLPSKEAFVIYPNPAKNVANIRVVSDTTGMVRFNIFDMNGRLVYSGQTEKQSNLLENSIDISHLAPGAYVVQTLIGTRKRIVSKLIKQ